MFEQPARATESVPPFPALIAVGGDAVPGRERAYRAFLALRRAVYVEENGYLDADAVPGEFESDPDDARSLAFAVLGEQHGRVRVLAALRLIVKGFQPVRGDDRLPVERYWPAEFTFRPAPKPSVEVSRLIARDADRRKQHEYAVALYTAVMSFVDEAGVNHAYGLVDPILERMLTSTFTLERVGEPRWIDQYHSENVAIEIAVPHVRRLSRWLPGRYETAGEILVGFGVRRDAAA
ncbi:hypothetical protein HQQ81_13410 [Microbacteriaceae bacterium VKM Ac-2854]|nr:hypothetical protein [Microbacteriaceae bacterium VKM Ac-2854]